VGILRRGRLVRHGPVADLLRVEDMVELVLAGDQPAAAVVERLALGPLALDVSGSAIRVRAAAQTEVLAALVRAGVPLRSLNPVTQTLEDVYVRATRRPPERVPVPMAGGPDANEPASNAGGAR
jgi:hypothetical protein